MRRLFQPLIVGLLLFVVTPGLVLAQEGVVTGSVTDAQSGETLPGVNVRLQEAALGAATDVDGQYRITGVEPGDYTLVASFVGYQRFTARVTVQAGEEVVQDVNLQPDRIGLEEIVVTGQAQGVASRRLSTTVESISPEQLEATPVTRLEDALQAQLKGSQVRLTSGQPGSATQIRGRGLLSVIGNSTPVIYVDGVRVDNLNNNPALAFGTGGVQSSSLADIPLENIERIEYTKGGAASTLFGSDAANGVIQIFTKEGESGESSFAVESRLGAQVATKDYLRFDETADVLFEPGLTQEYTFSGSGGIGEDARYSFGASAYTSDGFRVNNDNTRYSLRSRFDVDVLEDLQYTGSVGFSSNSFERVFNANTSFSAFNLLENGDLGNLDSLSNDAFDSVAEQARRQDREAINTEDSKRFQLSQSLQYQPLSNLTAEITGGVDYRVTEQEQIVSPTFLRVGGFGGQSEISRFERRFLSLTLEASMRHTANVGDFSFVSTVGGQVFRDEDRQTAVSVLDTPDNTTSINAGASPSAEDLQQLVANYGTFIQENIGFRDRYFIEGGLRIDGNSAFGDEVGAEYYPKVGASYVLSDEPFFQANIPTSVISSLKLRGNFGVTGQFPPAFANEKEVGANAYLGTASITLGQIGNRNLEPERVQTWEAGGNIAFLNERVNLDVTYFNSTTTNAILPVDLVPSSGRLPQEFNVGEIVNKGWELSSNVYVLQQEDVTLNLGASVNTTDNELTDIGRFPPFSTGGFTFLEQAVAEGEPVNFFRGNDPVFDEEGNLEDVRQDVNLGSPIPDWFGQVSINATLFDRLTFYAAADWQTGAQAVDVDEVLRFFNDIPNILAGQQPEFISQDRFPGENDPGAVQALTTGGGFFDLAGQFVEDSDYLKVRLISLNYQLPRRFFAGTPVQRVDLGVRVRNPFNFVEPDFDPEVTGDNASGAGAFAFSVVSPPREYLFNIRATF
jgi:outer membrane receptor protein involved in Fe transport